MSWLITLGVLVFTFVFATLMFFVLEGLVHLGYGEIDWKALLALIVLGLVYVGVVYMLHEIIVARGF